MTLNSGFVCFAPTS